MIKQILKNKVFQNFSFLTIGNVVTQIFGLIALIKIARIILPEDYGTYTFMLAQGQLLITIGDLGFRNIIIRSISRDNSKSKGLFITALKLKIIALVLLALLYLIYNSIWGNLNQEQLLLLMLFILFNCSTNLLECVFWGNQKMIITSIVNIIWSVIWLLLILILPDSYVQVTFLFSFFIIISLFKAGMLYLLLIKYGLLRGDNYPFIESSIKLLRESWPYLSLTLMMVPIVYLSNNFLDINSSTTEVGYFNLANKLMSPITLVIGFALSALFPNLSLLWVENPKKFNDRVSFGFKYIMIVALLLCLMFTLFAKEIVIFLFSEKYLPVVKVSQLQIWYVFLMGVNSIIGTIWGAVNMEKLMFKSSVINALITTPLIYYGSMFGALGISYGYVISFAIFEVYLWYLFKKSVNIKIEGDKYLWSLTIALFVVSFWFFSDSQLITRLLISIFMMITFFFYFLKSFKNYNREI
ncbi:oligosaccharide flippase family protein [Sediminicola sp. 1XM1-17]|uniref:oligosaccharide flippase family protein n=1 Tax=Sediminicola sp. 1XM1-17 TaxID=3127702 RepID=UPI00307898C7